MSKSSDFEKLIAKIYQELSPTAKIVHDDKIYDNDAEIFRQIDVSMRFQVAGHDI
jgi:hypothetical protein